MSLFYRIRFVKAKKDSTFLSYDVFSNQSIKGISGNTTDCKKGEIFNIVKETPVGYLLKNIKTKNQIIVSATSLDAEFTYSSMKDSGLTKILFD